MVMVGVSILISLALGFFCAYLKKKREPFSGWIYLLPNLVAYGVLGAIFGILISFIVGVFFIPKQTIVISEATIYLKPVSVNGKEVFLIKDVETNQLFYFDSGLEGEFHNISAISAQAVSSISYERGIRKIEFCKESFRNKKLKHIFLGGTDYYSRLILDSKDDIF